MDLSRARPAASFLAPDAANARELVMARKHHRQDIGGDAAPKSTGGPPGEELLARLLRLASRTFAVGIELLPGGLRDEVRVSYLLLRVSDFLEDNEIMPPARKAELLVRWAAVLGGEEPVESLALELKADLGEAGSDNPDALVAAHTPEVFRALEALSSASGTIIVHHVRASTAGMARWVERGPLFEDEADLDDYMHEVAGRVGHLLTELFCLRIPAVAARRERMMALGREFGLALQTVNVVRGLSADRRRGWIFVPRSYLPEGRDAAEIFDPTHRAVALDVVERLAAKAAGHFDSAEDYVRGIPRSSHRVRLFCLLPLLFGERTLAISRGNPEVLEGEAKIGRADVRRIVRLASLLGFSNAWVSWYRRRLEGR